jgi:hypothetical protein
VTIQNRLAELLKRSRWMLVSGAVLAFTASAAEAQLVSYDDFVGPRIDETKWAGRVLMTRDDGSTGALMEIRREVTPGQVLLLETRAVGGRASDSGEFSAENALAFRRPGAITDVAFAVWVKELDLTGCDAGEDSSAAARGVFALFNDGAGDVVAIAELRQSSGEDPGELDVRGSLIHRGPDGDTLIGSVELGSAAIDQRVRLRVRWEEANNRVRFQRDADPLVALDYQNAVVAPPGAPRKYLGAMSRVGDCSATGTNAAILAVFNNVRVNQ